MFFEQNVIKYICYNSKNNSLNKWPTKVLLWMSRTFRKMQGAKSKLQQVTFSCDLRIAVGIKRLLTYFIFFADE